MINNWKAADCSSFILKKKKNLKKVLGYLIREVSDSSDRVDFKKLIGFEMKYHVSETNFRG